MATQTINGKAFEYALLKKFYDRLSLLTEVTIIQNEPLKRVIECFDEIKEEGKIISRSLQVLQLIF